MTGVSLRNRAPLASLLVGVLWAVSSSPSSGEPPDSKPLDVDALVRAPRLALFSPPSVSPDGRLAAYTVVDPSRIPLRVDQAEVGLRTGVPWHAFGGDIWLSDLASRERRNLTKGAGDNWLPSWSPDGRYLAFFSDRESPVAPAEARLWVWDRQRDELRRVSDAQTLAFNLAIEWTSDGRVVVRLTPEKMSRREYFEKVSGRKWERATTRSEPDAGAATAKIFRFDPAAPRTEATSTQVNPDVLLSDLALIDVVSGAVERISTGRRIAEFRVSPDRAKVAIVVTTGYERAGSQQMVGGIEVRDVPARRSRELVHDIHLDYWAPEFRFNWSPRSDAVAYRASGPAGAKKELFVASLAGGAPRCLAEEVAKDPFRTAREGSPLWLGDSVVFGRDGALWRAKADGSEARLFAALPGKELTPVEMGSGQIWSPDAGGRVLATTFDAITKKAGFASFDGRTGKKVAAFEEEKGYPGWQYYVPPQALPDRASALYLAEDARRPPNFWRVPASLAGEPEAVSDVAPVLSRMEFGKAGLVEWKTPTGDTLRGALLYPAGYERGKRYPLIVKVYGGQDVSDELYQFGFSGQGNVDNLQILATRGYAVLLADSRQRVGTPMRDIFATMMPGVDRVIEMGVADPDRMGIMGHSYGGYSTLSLVVQTERFQAAVADAGFGDLVAAYGLLEPDGTNYLMSWAETGQGLMRGTPWEFRDRYIENSPVFFLDKVTTPVLLTEGSADYPTLNDEVFSDLRRLGKRVEYVRYEGEGHWAGTWSVANQKDKLERTIAWFDEHLKKDPSK